MTYLLDSSLLFLLLLVSLLLLFLSLLSFSFLKQYSTVQPRTHDCSHSQPLDCWDHSQVPPFCDKWLFSRKCVILLPVMLRRLPVMVQVEEDPRKENLQLNPLATSSRSIVTASVHPRLFSSFSLACLFCHYDLIKGVSHLSGTSLGSMDS